MRALFIGGCGRSGTTMLGDLLGAHEDHVCTPETSFKLGLVEQWSWGRDDDRRRAALDWLAIHRKFREFGVQLPPLRAVLHGTDLRGLLDALVESYRGMVGKDRASVWIDHTPTNIWMGLALLEAYPEARIVHLVRDGRAIAASVIPLDWGPTDVIAAAEFWIEFIVYGLALETARPDRVLRVRYEDLVTRPHEVLRAICSFADIAFSERMLNGGGLRVPASHADQHALVGKRPDPSRLQAWRDKLTPREVEIFEAEVGELLPLLGYEPTFGRSPRRASAVVELYYSARHRVLSSSLNRWRKRRRMERAEFRPRS